MKPRRRRDARSALRPPRRRRRRPEEAEAEILEAAERLLRRRPFRDLSVDQVMANTTLSRSSFYQYFPDIPRMVIRLVQRLGTELFPMSERWFRGTGDPAEDLRRAYEDVVAEYVKHGPVLRVIADASTHDRELEKAYRGVVDRLVRATAERIRRDQAAGLIGEPLDVEGTAEALMWMSERYLNEKLGRKPPGDPKQVVDTLLRIWLRTLYRRDLESSATTRP